jgi:hypothetical protein
VITGILLAVIDFAIPPLTVLGMFRILGQPAGGSGFYGWWAVAAAFSTASSLVAFGFGAGWPFGASGVLAMVLWWRSRRKGRKRAARSAGAKARARIAAMARNMPTPGRVLRPVPQGA